MSAARTRTSRQPVADVKVPTVELAAFAPIETHPADPPLWLVQPVMWLQPDLPPGLPASSELRVERREKIPVPGFKGLALTPAPGVVLPLVPEPREIPARLPLAPPPSGLAPLGWDPRALPTKGAGQ